MKCESCGADLPLGAISCEFCGSTTQAAGTPSRQAVFQRITQSPEYRRRQSPGRLAALPKYPAVAKVFMVVFPIFFIGVSMVMLIGMLAAAGVLGIFAGGRGGLAAGGLSLVPLLGAICPAAFLVLGVFLALQFRKKFRGFQQAPVLARPAVIVAKRMAVSGGSGDSSASTSYYLTAEFEDGTREEYQPMTPALYGRVAEDDAGVLFTRSSLALDFDRVVV